MPSSVPSRFSGWRKRLRLLRLDAAIGLLPAALDLRWNIEPQVAELSAAVPLARPSAALEFSVSPVAAWRVGIALVEQRRDLRLVEVRSRLRLRCSGGLAACTGFGGGFFSSFLIASAIGSTWRIRLLLVGFGSSFGFCSATFGGSGFLLDRLSSTFGCGAARSRSRPAASR
jgi:hypothetical protein